MAQMIEQWVAFFKQEVNETGIDNSFTRSPLQNHIEHSPHSGNARQTDLVPEIPPSTVYINFVTTMDVFSGYEYVHST